MEDLYFTPNCLRNDVLLGNEAYREERVKFFFGYFGYVE